MKKVYLAGPDIFRKDQKEYGDYLKGLCVENGFEGLWPMDGQVDLTDCKSGPEKGLKIYQADIDQVNAADMILVNLNPFRGVSADVGTCFEMGYAVAQGKKAFAYSSDRDTYKERAQKLGHLEDENVLEDFGLVDNLMMIGPVDNVVYNTVEEAIVAIGDYLKSQ